MSQRAFFGHGPLTDRDIEMGEETGEPVGASDVGFGDRYRTPSPLSRDGTTGVREAFVAAGDGQGVGFKAHFDCAVTLLHVLSAKPPQANRGTAA